MNSSVLVAPETVPVEFNLICEDSFKNTLIGVMFFAGYATGAFFGGIISDNFGRKTTLLVGSLMVAVSGFLSSLAASWWAFAIWKFVIGASCNVILIGQRVLAMELIHQQYRSYIV